MHELYKLKDMLMEELEEYGRKNEITAQSLEIVDKLAHALKNLCKIVKEYEEAEEEEEYSMAGGRGGSSYRRGSSYQGGGSGGNQGSPYRQGRSMRSYARGGGSGGNARRYSRTGGYSMEQGYSGDGSELTELMDEMREVMTELPEHKQREVQKFLQKMEEM